MRRSKLIGLISIIIALSLAAVFAYSLYKVDMLFFTSAPIDLSAMNSFSYYTISVPLVILSISVIGLGFWIGWTILTIKVVPPMAEIVTKKDFSKVKAFFLCIISLGLGILLLYGVYTRNFWALAIPAAVITLVVLGALFWVGLAIITTRTTLPADKK